MTQRRIRFLILALLAVLLAGLWLYAFLMGDIAAPAKTPRHLSGDIRALVQQNLAAPDNEVRIFVEYAHRTVKVKRLELVKCEVKTTDGAEAVNADLSNIERVEVVVRAVWDGWVVKDGATEVRYMYIPKDGKLHPTPLKVARTTARYTRSNCR